MRFFADTPSEAGPSTRRCRGGDAEWVPLPTPTRSRLELVMDHKRLWRRGGRMEDKQREERDDLSTLTTKVRKRQDQTSSSSSSDTPSITYSTSGSQSTTGSSKQPLFDGPTNTTTYLPTPTDTSSSGSSKTSSDLTSFTTSSSSSSTSSPSRTYKATWTYTPSTRSSASTPSSTPFVPGVVLNMTLAGDSDDQAVYSVQMAFGHGSSSGSDSRKGKRRDSGNWDGGALQNINLQLDLGSSDLVSYITCQTSRRTLISCAVGCFPTVYDIGL